MRKLYKEQPRAYLCILAGVCTLVPLIGEAGFHPAHAQSPVNKQVSSSTTNNADPPANEEIVIKGQSKPFFAKSSTAASKTSTPLIDTPVSVSVVTREQMDIQNARTLNEALRYTSGVATDVRGGNSRYDQFSIRGFIAGTGGASEYLDSLKLFNGAYFASQQIDPYLLERIDILKGPTSVIYGQNNPGGLAALTSKWANGRHIREVSLEGGNFDYARGTFDIADKFAGNEDFSFRLVGTATRQNGYDGYTRAEHYAFAPSVTWQPNADVKATLYARYRRDPSSSAYNTFPLEGTILPAPGGFHATPGFYMEDPNFNKFDRSQASVGYNVDYNFDKDWVLHSMVRYTNVGTNYNELGPTGSVQTYADGTPYVSRSAYGSKEHFDTVTLEERINGTVYTGDLKHNLLFGVSWQNLRDHYNYGFGTSPVYNLNLLNPIYHINVATPPLLAGFEGTTVSTNQEGIYAQDEASIDHWRFQFGIRYDWSSVQQRKYVSSTNTHRNDHAFTYRGGILYHFDNGLAPYFNYAQSFEPLPTTPLANGQIAKPDRGEQYEVGLKFQPNGFKSFMSVALYHLTESNVVINDEYTNFVGIQAGKQRSRGIEAEIHASLTDDINLIAAYTYQDVKVDTGKDYVRPTQIPKQFASFYGTYTVPNGMFKGLGFGIGVRYVSNTNGDTTQRFLTPSYALVDGQIHYDLGNATPTLKGLKLQVTAQNLGNKRYLTSCYSSSFGCSFGQSRTVIGRINYSW